MWLPHSISFLLPRGGTTPFTKKKQQYGIYNILPGHHLSLASSAHPTRLQAYYSNKKPRDPNPKYNIEPIKMQSKLFLLVLPLVGAALAMPIENEPLANTVAQIQEEYTGLEARAEAGATEESSFDNVNVDDYTSADNFDADDLDKRDTEHLEAEDSFAIVDKRTVVKVTTTAKKPTPTPTPAKKATPAKKPTPTPTPVKRPLVSSCTVM